jgi:hypothetical protein
MGGLHEGGHPFSYKIINFNVLLLKASLVDDYG